MRKKSVSFLSLIIFSIVLAGCGQSDIQTAEETTEVSIEVDEPVKEEPVTSDTDNLEPNDAAIEQEIEDSVVAVSDSEDDLKAILLEKCQDTLMVMIRDDFDEDGIYEAFAATSKDPYAVYFNDPDNASDCYDDYTIWYVTHEEASVIEDVSFGPNFVMMKEGTFKDGTKSVIVDGFMSNVDTDSYIFIVADGKYKYLGTHTSSNIADDGLLYSGHFVRDVDSNYFETEVFEYTNGELVLIDSYREDW